jgi:recombinational DNA repair protein RecT
MQMREVELSRSRSDAYRYAEKPDKYGNPPKKDSPWHIHFSAMARKTAMRQMLTRGSVPQDMGLGGILSEEEAFDTISRETVESMVKAGDAPTMSRSDQAREIAGLPPKNPPPPAPEAVDAEYREIMGDDDA